MDAVDEGMENLLSMPLMGTPKTLRNRALAGLRRWRVKGLKEILIFYVLQGMGVV